MGPLATYLSLCRAPSVELCPDLPTFRDMVAGPSTKIQATCSAKLATSKAATLLQEAPTREDRARLISVSNPMAGMWLMDGIISWKAIWTHENFLTALRLRLGLPHQGMHEIRQCICGREVDFRGLHHLHCKTVGNLIVAYNAVRDSIGNLCQAAGFFCAVGAAQ